MPSNAAQAKLAQIQRGTDDPAQASALAAAQVSYDSAQQKLGQLIAGGPAPAIQVAQANLRTAQGNLQLAVDQMELRSPIDGTVLVVNNSAGDSVGVSTSASSGSTLGTTIFQIGSLSNQLVQISVNHLDAPNVRAGQAATVQLDAFPGRTFDGTVAVVTHQGTSTSGVITFPVTVAIKNPPPNLGPAMTATVDVIISQPKDVLILLQAEARPRATISATPNRNAPGTAPIGIGGPLPGGAPPPGAPPRERHRSSLAVHWTRRPTPNVAERLGRPPLIGWHSPGKIYRLAGA